MKYRISNQFKKNVTETEIWANDAGETIEHNVLWRWGSWIANDKPNLSNYDPEVGADPFTLANEIDLESTDDGDGDWEYPDSWDEDKIAEFQEAWDEEWHDAPEKFGFIEQDTEFWITGPLEVEEIE